MSDIDLEKMQTANLVNAYVSGDFITQATITFTICSRTIFESKASPEIKGDAMAIAIKYFQNAIGADLCDRMLDVKDISGDLIIGLTGVELFNKMRDSHDRLKNIMELL